MTDYSKLTDFASKDSLPTGNSAKIIKGTEIDDEFESIETAVNTKANITSPILDGTPKAPTASAGTSTTQIATTAFVQAAMEALHPVGSIYINATDSTNPGTLLGFGTWVEFGSGKVLVSQDTGDSTFDTLEGTGGSKDAVVVSHTHTDDGHRHGINNLSASGSAFPSTTSGGTTINLASRQSEEGFADISTEGVSGSNKNLQPYIVVKMWKRTA